MERMRNEESLPLAFFFEILRLRCATLRMTVERNKGFFECSALRLALPNSKLNRMTFRSSVNLYQTTRLSRGVRFKIKNGGVKPSFFAFVVLRLFFRNRFNRAFASASAAVNTYVGIDCIYVAVLSDCFYGAGGRASAASQAEFFIDYVCHI